MMQKISHWLVYTPLYLLSLLPLRVLFLFSDFIYLLVYYVFGYRKKVVFQNLSIIFPNHTYKQKEKIAKGVYRNFTDFIVESIKLFSASDAWVNKHFVGNVDVLDKLYEEGKKCQVHLGHNFSWEIGQQWISMHLKQPALSVYTPISNKTLDRIFKQMRSQRGGVMLPANDMKNAILPYRDKPYALLLVADQRPRSRDKAMWIPFFGKETAFVRGPETGARMGNLAVVFCYVEKLRRGYYKCYLTLETNDPTSLEPEELTRRYARYLEEKIVQQPENWLWTHKRWKWEREVPTSGTSKN